MYYLAYKFQEDWFEGWVQFFTNILQQTRFTETNGVLQTPQEITICQFDDVNARLSFLW